MSKSARIVLVFTFLTLVRTAVGAYRSPQSIDNITVPYDPLCNNTSVPVNIGSISSISVVNGTGGGGNGYADGTSVMQATYTVSAAAKTAGIFKCMNIHWVQLIESDDAPSRYMGATPKFPIIDPPKSGWDYMWNYDMMGKRTTMKPAFANYVDDNPWYYNAAGEAANSTVGDSYRISDQPGNAPAVGRPPVYGKTVFDTFLVATPTMGCKDANCMTPGQFDVLAGFQWIAKGNNTTDTASSYINALYTTNADLTAELPIVKNALTNGGFGNDFTAVTGATICCPEPAVAGLILIGAMLTVAGRVRRAA